MSVIDGMLLGGMHPDQVQRIALASIDRVADMLRLWRERAEAAEARVRTLEAALSLAESVYRQNVVAAGEPSSALDAMRAALGMPQDYLAGNQPPSLHVQSGPGRTD